MTEEIKKELEGTELQDKELEGVAGGAEEENLVVIGYQPPSFEKHEDKGTLV